MDESMKAYLHTFLNDFNSKNKQFSPPDNKMLKVFKADWLCGKFEPTQQGRIHLHMLVKFWNFKLIQNCYRADNFDQAVPHIHELLAWVNKNITSFVNFFGKELEDEIAKFQMFKIPDVNYDTSKGINPKLIRHMNQNNRKFHSANKNS